MVMQKQPERNNNRNANGSAGSSIRCLVCHGAMLAPRAVASV